MPVHRACVLLILLGGAWLALSALATESRIAIAVEGARYQYEPATIRLRIRVEPDPANRALTVALVSGGFERSSLEELDGDRAARTRWINYPDVPAGEYAVIAVVHQPDRSTRAQERITVLARY